MTKTAIIGYIIRNTDAIFAICIEMSIISDYKSTLKQIGDMTPTDTYFISSGWFDYGKPVSVLNNRHGFHLKIEYIILKWFQSVIKMVEIQQFYFIFYIYDDELNEQLNFEKMMSLTSVTSVTSDAASSRNWKHWCKNCREHPLYMFTGRGFGTIYFLHKRMWHTGAQTRDIKVDWP